MAVLAVLAVFAEAAPVTLELRAKPGEVRRYTLKTVAEQRPALAETLQGASTVTTFSGTVRLSVKQVDAEGQLDLLGQFQKLDLQMKMGDQVLDAGDLPMIGDMKGQLLKQVLTFKVSKKGEIKEVQMPAFDETKVLESLPMFGEAGKHVKRTLESFVQHAFSWLPEGPIEIGKTWTRDMQSGLVTDPPLTFKMTHKFEAMEKMKGQECAKIISVIDVPATDFMDGAFSFVGSGTSTTYFAIKTGQTLSSKSVLKVKFTSKEQESSIESTVTTTIEAQ